MSTVPANGPGSTFVERVTAVERAYEYMVAYAAQGRRSDVEGNEVSSIRDLLTRASLALDGLSRAKAEDVGLPRAATDSIENFTAVIREDSRKARAMIGVVLAQPAISSAMVDNLNASVHLRTLITDLFVISAVIKAATPES